MSYKLTIREGARLDAESAYLYYEEQQEGLGERFLEALQKRFADISEHPHYYSYIDKKKLLRDIAIPHFPYVIVFAIMTDEVKNICRSQYASKAQSSSITPGQLINNAGRKTNINLYQQKRNYFKIYLQLFYKY